MLSGVIKIYAGILVDIVCRVSEGEQGVSEQLRRNHKRKYVYVVFMGFEKAYDWVNLFWFVLR